MRLWGGCSFLFSTLNPHDIHSPLLLLFSGGPGAPVERVSLDLRDEGMAGQEARARGGSSLGLHELAAAGSRAACT